MAEQDMKYNITKFNGTDFALWKDKILNALNALEFEDVIKEEFDLNEGNDEARKAKKKKDEKAKVILISTIHDNILRNISRNTSKDIWKALMAKYEVKNVQNIISLRRKFINSKQGQNETIEEYIDRIKNVRNEIEKTENEKLKDQDVAIVILQGLSQEYDYFVQVLTANTDKLELDNIIISLIQEEQRRGDKKKEHKSIGGDVFYSKEKSHTKKKYSKNIKCYNCNKMGHYASDCRLPKKDRNNKNANFNYKSESKDKTNEREDIIFHISDKNLNAKNTWILDSGATNHISCLRSMFKQFKHYDSTIKVGDGRQLQVKGIGTVECEIITRGEKRKLVISETLYVPDLSTNLISIGVLSKKGFEIIFSEDSCKIKLNNELIAEGTKWANNGNLYQLNVKVHSESKAMITKINDWKLWHYRLGHLSTQNMKKLKAEDIELHQEKDDDGFCEGCALGKAKKSPHKTIEREEKSEHVTIHSDLVGPMKTTSIGGKKYILTYLCSKTEFSFVYYLRSKDEQFDKFKEFKNHYELLTGTKIKFFHTDNGREYISNQFQNYLKDNGIKHNTSVEYCPQSNGKAERLNLTLLIKARCMLNSAKLDFMFEMFCNL